VLVLVFGGGPTVSTGPSAALTVVEETADREPAQAALWTQLQTSLPDHHVKILDKDDPYAPEVDGNLPVIIIYDAEKREIYHGPCPKTLAGVKELL
tara:strand:+ start:5251 stop:5538 length:288 start_codon:yes stop_codon:yes gene_type:complete